MGLMKRPIRAGAVAVLGLAMTAMTGTIASASAMAAGPPAAAAAGPQYVALAGSLTPTTDRMTGSYSSARMPIEVALTPGHPAQLSTLARALYAKGSGQFHHWLGKGAFARRFAPSAAERSAVSGFLRGAGLTVQHASSPFLIRATGSSRQLAAAFGTNLSSYRDARGISYFSNSTALHMPASIAAGVQGVIGLSNTARLHTNLARASTMPRPAVNGGATPACENGYPSAQTLFNFVNNGVGFAAGYGDAPGCNGLTPSQLNSLYGAPSVGAKGKGKGVTLAVFELSAYQQSDIDTFAQTLIGKNFTPNLQNIMVDGGPQNPVCPAGDSCVPASGAFSGDDEVDADIETQLAISPKVSQIQVYEAPNDNLGITNLDMYTKIAADDTSDSISSSWAGCENDVGAGLAMAENTIFEQMALQGQSMFGSSGDTGAFSCIRGSGLTKVETLDPASQPFVTGVGGTSFESDNPGVISKPSYPKNVETVWNVDNLCNASANEGNHSGFFWCAETGAAGGGNSQFWGRPFYQHGPGINSQFSTVGNGTTQCSFVSQGTPCREVPDISGNADEFTPYAEFCTANANTPGSACGFSAGQTPPGWFGIGGTSLSSPLWSAIIADRDSFQGFRAGNINPMVYQLYRSAPSRFFHDITGVGAQQAAATNNGLFPTLPGYDLATGIGTPKMAQLITAKA
jgi:subtilase family serine protease